MTLGQLSILAAALFLVGSAEVVAGPLMTAMAPDFGVLPAAIAYLPAAYGLAYAGFHLGKAWDSNPELRAFMHRFDAVIIALILVGLAWYVWRHWRHRVRRDR